MARSFPKFSSSLPAILLGLLFVAGLAALLATPTLSPLASREDRINREIRQANRCETAADCGIAASQCPFGCYVAVHKDETARIEALISSYQSTCIYSCIQMKGVDCVKGKCEVQY